VITMMMPQWRVCVVKSKKFQEWSDALCRIFRSGEDIGPGAEYQPLRSFLNVHITK
jgi:hypothetical protein